MSSVMCECILKCAGILRLISGVREFSDITVFDGIVLELMTHDAFEAAFLRPTCEQIYC